MRKEQLVGAWRLVSYELRLGDGIVIHPLGEGVQGWLMYDAEGHVMVQLMDPERPQFASGDWLQGTPEEIKAAFEGSLAYYGSYELNGDKGTVVHHVVGSTFPNWAGTDQERVLELNRNRLTLITPTLPLSGEQIVGRLVFERG